MNKSKVKGTRFESEIVKELQKIGIKAERIALSGIKDKGDIKYNLLNSDYMIEAKCYKKDITPLLLKQFQSQTLKELKNGKYKTAFLVIKKHGQNIGFSDVWNYRKDLWSCVKFSDFIRRLSFVSDIDEIMERRSK